MLFLFGWGFGQKEVLVGREGLVLDWIRVLSCETDLGVFDRDLP